MIDRPRIGPPPPASPAAEPGMLAKPANLAILAGLAVLAGAEFVLSWASIPERVIIDGRNEPDGLITLLIGLLILLVVVSHSAASSDSRIVQVLPALLSVSLLAALLDGVQVTTTAMGDYQSMGTAASLDPGMAVEVIGSMLVAAGGAATSVAFVRMGLQRRAEREAARPTSHGQWVSPEKEGPKMERVTPDLALPPTVGAAGAALGLVTAVWLDGAMGGSARSVARLAALGLVGILLGPALSVSLWRRSTRRRP